MFSNGIFHGITHRKLKLAAAAALKFWGSGANVEKKESSWQKKEFSKKKKTVFVYVCARTS